MIFRVLIDLLNLYSYANRKISKLKKLNSGDITESCPITKNNLAVVMKTC